MASSPNFGTPNGAQLVDQNGALTSAWAQWFSRAQTILSAVQSSGVTADRPASLLWIGRTYFDTTLGKPVWVKTVKPTVVWCDATGAAV